METIENEVITYEDAQRFVAQKHELEHYLEANVWNRANELAKEVAELYANSKFKAGYKQGWDDAKSFHNYVK